MNKIFVTCFSLAASLISSMASAQNYSVSTVAGNSTAGLLDGIGTAAQCNTPYSVKSDGGSTIYFADTYNHAIRKYDIITGQVTTIAGNGVAGYVDGPCTTARFNYPEGVFYKNNFLYIGDNINNVIRKIDLINNTVSTIAGSGAQGYLDGPVGQAKFYQPKYLIVDNANNVLVADYENHCIRKISGGQVTTIAGIGGTPGYQDGPTSTALFHRPADLCMDTTTGFIYVTDIMNHVIRRIDTANNVTTFAGTGVAGNVDGPAASAQFIHPTAIDITCQNNFIYVADGYGGDNIRKISVANGTVSTVAGVYSVTGWQDGSGSSALFNQIQGLCFDPHGNLYVGDAYNSRIRKITVPEGAAGNPCLNMTGIQNAFAGMHQLNLYPNPSKGLINFEMGESTESISYMVTDFLGKTVKRGSTSNGKLDISELDNGAYLITFSNGNSQSTNNRVILQK